MLFVGRLTPRNCPVLSNGGPTHSQPWSDMMVKMLEITSNMTGGTPHTQTVLP